MQLLHIYEPSLMILVDRHLDIVQIQRVPRDFRPQDFVIKLRCISARPYGAPIIVDGIFETDGLGCIRLFLWVAEQYPRLKVKALGNKFEALFADNPEDVMLAVSRIYNGTWGSAPGECATFCNDQWNRHPREMFWLTTLGIMMDADRRLTNRPWALPFRITREPRG